MALRWEPTHVTKHSPRISPYSDVTVPMTSIPLALFTDPSGVSDDSVPPSSVHVFPITSDGDQRELITEQK